MDNHAEYGNHTVGTQRVDIQQVDMQWVDMQQVDMLWWAKDKCGHAD